VATAALVLCATRCAGETLRVALEIAEPVGVARAAEPVTVGIPLPSGRVRDLGTLWIADPAGRRTPAQPRALERWPDGTLKWVLVDFLASVGARETVIYRLRTDRAPAPPRAPALAVGEEHDLWRIETGAAELVFPRRGRSLLDAVRLGNGGTTRLETTCAPAVEGGPPAPVEASHAVLETSGPIRTEILLEARDSGGLAFETRLATFAGSTAVRLQLTVTSLAARPYTDVRALPVAVQAPDVREAVFGVAGGVRRLDTTTPRVLRQPDARETLLDGTRLDGAADGWARASGPATMVTIVRRFFAEEWPQAFRIDRSGIAVDLLDGSEEPVALGIGAAKTFELWIVFDDPARPRDPDRLAQALRHPLVAHVDAAWTAASGALPNALAPAGPGVAALLPRLETATARYLARNRAERWDDGPPVPCEERRRERERVGAFGALNWGDWNFPGYRDRSEGCDAWGNLEYDLPQVLGLQWAVTGSRPTWDAFVAAARHYRDVDIVHFAPGHEEWVGINHPHKVRHFAVESPNTVDLGHTWLEGLVTHYRLTGEVRSLAAARGIADVLVRRLHKAGNPRQYGWPMIALAAAFDATGDSGYRDAARGYADAAVVLHEATPAAGDWKMGILADGFAAVHAITDEARLRNWLVGYADALVAEPARFDDPRYRLPLGYLARVTGRAAYRDLGLGTVAAMPIGDWGKTLAISGRTAFRILAPLRIASMPSRGAAPPPSAGEPRSPSPSPRAPARRRAR
jgi:hypothetical protein